MTHEVLTFVQTLGCAEVGFYGDNEPTIRQILKTVITSRHALGLKTRVFAARVKDSASNSLVENAIQRVRQLACTLVQDVSSRTGLTFPCEHALWSWAGRHAAWCLNRYQVGKDVTSYELIHGRTYAGKICRFAEPVYAYCKPRGKADARWKVGLFLGKTEAQDAWIIGDGVDVMLTRSIRRVDKLWTKNLAYFTGLQTHSFVYQTSFGGRIVPSKRKVAPQRQEGRVLPKLSEVEQRFADEEAAAVMAYARSRQGRLEEQQEVREALEELPDRPLGGTTSVVDPLPAQLGAGGVQVAAPGEPSNATMLAMPSSPRGQVGREGQRPDGEEPSAKRSCAEESLVRRMATIERRLVEVEFAGDKCYHLDEIYSQENVMALDDELGEKELNDNLNVNKIPEEFWSDALLTRTPPEPLPEVDRKADEVEVQRLQAMGVLAPLSEEEERTLGTLTTRMVYDWRVKDYTDPKTNTTRKRWMRRARLVAREYAHQRRDDVHSPASGGQSLRLLPALYLMLRSVGGVEQKDIQIGALDIKDAFLQVEQEVLVQVTTKVGKFRVDRNLPGQRIGAKAWFDHLTEYLKTCDYVFSRENPCLGRRDDGTYLLIHVDDIMFCGMTEGVKKLIMQLKEKFNISVNIAQYEDDTFEFLKRTYKLKDDGIDIMPGCYDDSMIEALENRYGKVKLQSVPCGEDAQDIGSTHFLPMDEAMLYRSLVGSGIYLSQERIEVAFVVKQLASGMSNPTYGHLQVMRKLIGYLKATKGYHSHLGYPSAGQGVHHHYDSKWVVESFTDADWSGNKQTRRSTSGAIHCVNGLVCFHSSRGQKVVSLSSAESELHSLVSGATDGVFVRRCLGFLIQEEPYHVCLIDNSATKQIANKRGSGRLRHVNGKELWIQDQVAAHEMEVKQIRTVLNIGDMGTKPLGKARLQALMCWCNIRDKNDKLVGEEEASKLKETQLNKVKIMRVAKMLYAMVLVGGLESADAMMIPLQVDPPEVYIQRYIMVLAVIFIVTMCMVVFYVVKAFQVLHGRVRALEQDLQRCSNELEMHHLHGQALQMGIIRLGGYVDLNEHISENDWDNWNYIQKQNIVEENYDCRRVLRSLGKDTRALQKRASTPTPRTSRSHDDLGGEDGSEGDDLETADERRHRYLQATMSEVSDPDDWADLHYGPHSSPPRRSSRRSSRRTSRARSSRARSPDAEPEGAENSGGESEDALREDFRADTFLEWPSIDWRSSFNRAQLKACRVIVDLCFRAIEAAENGHEPMAQWCQAETAKHRQYSDIGMLELPMPNGT